MKKKRKIKKNDNEIAFTPKSEGKNNQIPINNKQGNDILIMPIEISQDFLEINVPTSYHIYPQGFERNKQ